MAALCVIGAVCWMITSVGAFSRARDQHRYGGEGWTSDAFWLGMAAAICALDLVGAAARAFAQ
jgi:hypothetical protein